MDLKQIESFVRVAELGSFTRAAVALGIAQPLLSRHVRQLEVEHRQTFLLRNGRGVTPTEAGLVLLAHGRGLLHQVALAREELGASRGGLAGHVSMGFPPSLSKLITVPLVHAFQRQLPQAQLTLTEGFSVSMYESLRAGRLDLAVLYNPPMSPDLEMSTLHKEELLLIASEQCKLHDPGVSLKTSMALASLSALPLILPSRPNAFRLLIDSEMMRIGCKPNIVLEVDGLNAIMELVKVGLGYAILPSYALSNHTKPHPFTTHKIHTPKLISQLLLAWSSRRPMTATHKEALRLTREVVSQVVHDPAEPGNPNAIG